MPGSDGAALPADSESECAALAALPRGLGAAAVRPGLPPRHRDRDGRDSQPEPGHVHVHAGFTGRFSQRRLRRSPSESRRVRAEGRVTGKHDQPGQPAPSPSQFSKITDYDTGIRRHPIVTVTVTVTDLKTQMSPWHSLAASDSERPRLAAGDDCCRTEPGLSLPSHAGSRRASHRRASWTPQCRTLTPDGLKALTETGAFEQPPGPSP